MTPDAAGIEAALAAGLAAHQMVATAYYQRTHQWDASCRAGDWSECGEMGGRDAAEAAHRAHVAAALLPLVTQAQAEALREFAKWVATHRAYNGSNYPHGQSLYNECLNAVLPAWAQEFARADESGAR